MAPRCRCLTLRSRRAMPASLILREARAGGIIPASTFTDPRAVKKQELLERCIGCAGR